MELGTKNPPGRPYAPAIDTSAEDDVAALLTRLEDVPDTPTETEIGTDAASLRRQEQSLIEELRTSMLEGDAAAVLRIRTMLADYPARILAADCDEIKRGLDNATERLAQVQEEIDYVREERREKNRILAERLVEARAAEQEVFKDDFKLDILKMEQTSLHQARREYRLKLETIMEDAVDASGVR